MSETKEWISFRVKPGEYELIEQFSKSTTCRSLSEYARKVLLSKPVIVKYRNQSADQFLAEMLLFKNELSAIGNNFNQAVKRLHSLDSLAQTKPWLLIYDSTHKAFMKKVAEINNHLVKIYELWSQK